MNDKRFFDSNIVVYLYSQDEPDKQSIAKNLFRNNQPIISTQVLGELANVLRRKFQLEYTDIAAEFKNFPQWFVELLEFGFYSRYSYSIKSIGIHSALFILMRYTNRVQ